MTEGLSLDRPLTLDEAKRENGLRSARIFLYAYVIVIFMHVLSATMWGNLGNMNVSGAVWSIILNLFYLVAIALFLLLNRLAGQRHWHPALFYTISMRAVLGLSLPVWLYHIHMAGSSFTILAMLIPITALLASWFLGPRDAWLYLLIGSAGLVAIVFAERVGTLPFFPMLTDAQDLQLSFFQESRYVLVQLLIYVAFAIVTVYLSSRLQRDIGERDRALAELTEQLEILAMTDPLTALFNRRTIMDLIKKEMARTERGLSGFSLVMADIDDFKRINDTYGHAAGDLVIRRVAVLLQENSRPYDMVARIGGEEFLVVIKDTEASQCLSLAERARAAIAAEDFQLMDGTRVRITVSFGCTTAEATQLKSLDLLLHDADDALYESKKQGKNRVTTR
ncbi:MAG: GGDEF domain-containing protein [Candidatus Lernaella stagnicola]|nr:GGDEF domain-containing protein [Candidatus Lernaella stagnicola]